MKENAEELGALVSFYSYKGGTGRSMALANVACLLARRLDGVSRRVLAVDWDLEAPGLHRFFPTVAEQPEHLGRPGILNHFQRLDELFKSDEQHYTDIIGPNGVQLLARLLPLDEFIVPDVVKGLDLIKAGDSDVDYARQVAEFRWADFYDRFGGVFGVLRDMLCERYAYCLIDSRTGLNDISGICAMILPEKLVAMFTPNVQSLSGVLELVEQAVQYRRASDDFRPLAIFPLPSRIELGEKTLREEWRRRYQSAFEDLFRRLYELDACDLTEYFDEVQLPHVSYYAYGESIAVVGERSEALSLSRAYQALENGLVERDVAWAAPVDNPQSGRTSATPPGNQRTPKAYDAYISHSARDSRFAEALATRMRNYGLRPYLDLWELLPGVDMLTSIDDAIQASASLVILVGRDGTGAWEDEEISRKLSAYVHDRTLRVIPVLLHGASRSEKGLSLPDFLQRRNFVDMTDGVDDDMAFIRLVGGVRGQVVKPRMVVTFRGCEHVRTFRVGEKEDAATEQKSDQYHLRASFELDGRNVQEGTVNITVRRTETPPAPIVEVGSVFISRLNKSEFERAARTYFFEAMGVRELPVSVPASIEQKTPKQPNLVRKFTLAVLSEDR